MRKLFSLCLYLLSPLALAFSEADLVQLLQKAENVQGNFVQQRFLKSLPQPIRAEGKFTLVTHKGLLWQMEQPFANQMRVRQDGIMQWDGKQWVSNGNLVQNEQIRLFLGLLSGDVSALKSQFDFSLTGDQRNWQLTLLPSSLLMKQIFTQIQLRGDQNVQQIQLDETQGDKTLILFSQQRQNQPLSPFAQQALQ